MRPWGYRAGCSVASEISKGVGLHSVGKCLKPARAPRGFASEAAKVDAADDGREIDVPGPRPDIRYLVGVILSITTP
jgi:hypothetical protein